MTDRSMFDEDYDPADVVLPRMSRNRRVIGRLPTEPTGDDLMRDLDTYRRWNEGTHLDDDYPTTGEATDAHQRIFAAVPRLLALVAAQAEQIAVVQSRLLSAEFDAGLVIEASRDRADEAEAKIARVRALCDETDGAVLFPFVDITGQRHGATVRTDRVRAALDGTEATP